MLHPPTSLPAAVSPGAGQEAAAGEPLVRFRGVQKTYDGVHVVVQRLDLDIRRGEFLTLLGPSGSGKTTTLMMLAGFESPTAGDIVLEGRPITRTPPHKRHFGMVFQNYALFPHLSVGRNVAYPLTVRKVAKAEQEQRVARALGMVRLDGMADRLPSQLSGGQQQRVALARALVFEPQLVLMDEPLGALDKQLREHMQIELKELHRQLGVTFVYVTHDQGEALTMSDRIAVMNAGRVEQLGTPREVYETPSTRFVADFIGTSNIITVKADRIDGGDAVMAVDDKQRVVVPLRDGPAAAGELTVTVRPEKMNVGRELPEADCRVTGTVREVVYQGTFTAYAVAMSTGDTVQVHRQNAEDSHDLASVGDTVWVSWARAHSYVLHESPAPTGGTHG
jgi:putative spermidine/putrescine transport system ATP-binding protein